MRTYEVQLIGGRDVIIKAPNRDAIDDLFNIVMDITGIECVAPTREPDFTIITPGDD